MAVKCMRCGIETMGKQVFCNECLASMEKYPVAPGTAVHLPLRSQNADVKKSVKKKREVSAEEQIARLQKKIRRLTLFLFAALAAAAILGAALFLELTQETIQEAPSLPVGRNYSTTEGA